MLKTSARKYLWVCWMVFMVVAFLLATIWIVTDLFGSQTKLIITWLMQSILPYISLVFTSHFLIQTKNNEVDPIYFYLALVFSILYMICILIICGGLCYSRFFNSDPNRIINDFGILTAVFQTILTSSLGLFFLKEKTTIKSH